MTNTDKRVGPKCLLNNKKIKALFPAMMISPQNKYIAYQLGVTRVKTISDWVNAGDVLQEKFENELEELEDIFSFEYEPVFENRKIEFDAQFRLSYGLEPEDKIPDRLRLTYDNFMLNEKRKFIEGNISRREKEILDDITLSDNKQKDEEYKMYIRFARIYHRAKCVKEIGYLQNIDKHAGTSKNVGLSLKMLEKMNPEEFGEKQIVQHSGNIEVANKSILAIALNLEQQNRVNQQAISTDNSKVIDIQATQLIEEKNP